MDKKRLFVIFVVSLIVCVPVSHLLRYMDRSYHAINFVALDALDVGEDAQLYYDGYGGNRHWISQRHPKFFEELGDRFKPIYHRVGLAGHYYEPVNFNKYTYIITKEHELVEINYSYSNMQFKKRLFEVPQVFWIPTPFPKEFIGRVKLKKELHPNKIFIYQIPIMDIDNAYQLGKEEDVEFVD